MSVAPMLPPESSPSKVRGPRGAVVIPFPVRPAGPGDAAQRGKPAEPDGAPGPERPAAWPVRLPRRVARPRRVVRPARPPRPGAGAAAPAGLRLTRRGRLVVAAAVLLAALAAGALATPLVRTGTAIPPTAPAVVQVQPGETVWSIAERVAPQADTRAVVDAIIARNHLAGGAVHPGQRLVIRP
jgi:hypothetical protein